MIARNLVVRHHGEQFAIECDTDLGFEILQHQASSLTSVPPEDQRRIYGWCPFKNTKERGQEPVQEEERERARAAEVEKSDEELARMLQAEEEALLLQRYTAGSDGREFEQRVRNYVPQVLMYEDPVRQDAARKTVPIDQIEEKALVALAKEGILKPSQDESDHAFLLQLLLWFKESFRWVNSPPCDNCGGSTNKIGMGNPEHLERKFGADHVELYRCNICSSITRFPRYNDPMKLLETRKGRCGEWANCFTLYCRAFGYDARLILDFTDHLWTECFSRSLERWMHLDPCEGVYDKPLLYEKGWNKKLNYVIAIAKDGTYDVTKRYTRKWHEVLSRRNLATEDAVAAVLSSIRKECRAGFSSEICHLFENRDDKESEELERGVYLQVDASISLPGRQSGAIAWRVERSECSSSENNSLSSSSCPIRKCVDDHVTSIYTAFALLYAQIIAENLPQASFFRMLVMLQTLLVNLKNQPFKNRSSLLGQFGSQISEKLMLCIETFLSAISLKRKLGYSDSSICFSLSGDPVQTSLALPVALDLVNEIMDIIKENDVLSTDVQFPKVNRLSSGSVLASSEELPFGISTSAFDGTLSTKWEEPNGANGCWLIYKAPNSQMYELQSYDFLSANDAPERDPMNWILEGSGDGGSTWNILDEQNSQIFERRFQRKTFSVKKKANSNTFRFRFLLVRDAKATSRFQIGGINLYVKK